MDGAKPDRTVVWSLNLKHLIIDIAPLTSCGSCQSVPVHRHVKRSFPSRLVSSRLSRLRAPPAFVSQADVSSSSSSFNPFQSFKKNYCSFPIKGVTVAPINTMNANYAQLNASAAMPNDARLCSANLNVNRLYYDTST